MLGNTARQVEESPSEHLGLPRRRLAQVVETTWGCPGLVIVGRLVGGAGLAGGVRATENLGRVELDRVGKLP
jgi:hypothetical protein